MKSISLPKKICELKNAKFTVEKMKKAKKGKIQKTKYMKLMDEKENLKQKYVLKLITRREYLISIGHKFKNREKQDKRAETAISLVDNDDEVPLRITIQSSDILSFRTAYCVILGN